MRVCLQNKNCVSCVICRVGVVFHELKNVKRVKVESEDNNANALVAVFEVAIICRITGQLQL